MRSPAVESGSRRACHQLRCSPDTSTSSWQHGSPLPSMRGFSRVAALCLQKAKVNGLVPSPGIRRATRGVRGISSLDVCSGNSGEMQMSMKRGTSLALYALGTLWFSAIPVAAQSGVELSHGYFHMLPARSQFSDEPRDDLPS